MIPFDDTSVSPVAAAVDSAATFCGAVPAADTLPIAATAEAGCPQGLVPWPQADTLAASEHAATLWGWVSDWTEKGRETVASADASVSEVFGSASTLAGGGVPDAVTSGFLAQAVGFQAVVLLLATLYLLLFYTNSSEVRMLAGSFGLDRNTGQRTLGKSGIFHTHFLRRCAVLGAMGLGVLSVKLCDEWLPAEALAGLGPLLRQGFCIGVLAAVEHHRLFAERDVGVRLHQHLEEVELAGIGNLVNLYDVFVILQVDSREQVTIRIGRAERGHNHPVRPCGQRLDVDALVAAGVHVRLAGVLGLALGQLVVVGVEVVHAHQDAQVRVVTDGHGDGLSHGLQLAQHGGLVAVHYDEVLVLGHLREDAVEQVVVVLPVLAVDVVVAQLELHLLGQFRQQRILRLGRQLGEH